MSKDDANRSFRECLSGKDSSESLQGLECVFSSLSRKRQMMSPSSLFVLVVKIDGGRDVLHYDPMAPLCDLDS